MGVYNLLESDGFNVSVVQNPTISLEGDVAATKMILDQQPEGAILAGHSYGGAVITEAGTHEKVAGLVYVTAFAPDAGESVNTLIANPPPGAPVPPILPPIDGYLFLDKQKFAASFAGDVDAATAKFMASSQVPWGLSALGGTITTPAWKSKPSWYLLVTDDKMIPLPAQQRAVMRSTCRIRARSPRSSKQPRPLRDSASPATQHRLAIPILRIGPGKRIGGCDIGLSVRRRDRRRLR